MYYYGQGVQKNNKKAFEWFENAAKQNDKSAQYWLGYMYWRGYGTKPDAKKSFEWFLKSAEQGDVDSQRYVGLMYKKYKEYKLPKDYEKAIYWLTKAAEQKDKIAMHNLACLYYNGGDYNEFPINWAKAKEWYQKAYDNGYGDSKLTLDYLKRMGY